MLRRRPARVRRHPAWELAPAFPEIPVGSAARRPVPWLATAAAAVLCAVAGWATRSSGGIAQDIPRSKPSTEIQQVEVQARESRVEAEPQDPQEAPRTAAALPSESPVASAPSVGLVEAGAAGGSGNGLPGLDLGLEGSGAGLAVASGGGGRGSGVGTGTGNGIGSQRMVYQMGQVDQDASVGRLESPPYPRRAKEDMVEAHLELRILVDERGKVEKVEVLGAPPGYGFESAVESASRSWRFQPAQLGGVPVPQWVRMPLDFHLN